MLRMMVKLFETHTHTHTHTQAENDDEAFEEALVRLERASQVRVCV